MHCRREKFLKNILEIEVGNVRALKESGPKKLTVRIKISEEIFRADYPTVEFFEYKPYSKEI